MPDDKTIKHPHYGKRIDIDDPNELSYWAEKFGVSEIKLKLSAKLLKTTSISHLRKHFNK